MPIVPIVKRVEEQALPSARYSSSYNAPNPAAGVAQLADTATKTINQFQERADTAEMVGLQGQLDNWEAQNIYDARNGVLSKRGENAFGTAQAMRQKFQTDTAEMAKNLSWDQQEAFSKMVASRSNSLGRILDRHEASQRDEFDKQTVQASVDSSINRAALNFQDPALYSAAINNAKAAQVAWGHANGLPDQAIANSILETESKANLALLSRWADTDPKTAIDFYKANMDRFTGQDLIHAQSLIVPTERRYKATGIASNVMGAAQTSAGRDDIINFVMNTLEGGDKVKTDSNGALAKYGINAKANPDLDIQNLTPEAARERYVSNYWNKIGGDTLAPDMRLAAMSFAATSGAQKAKDLLQEADGDVGKFQQLAAQFYQDLAKKDPAQYGPSLQGWMNRLSTVSAEISYQRGELPNVYDLNNRIDGMTNDPQIAEDAKRLVNQQVESMRKARRDSEDTASRTAWQYRQQGMEVPPTIIARMNPKEAQEMMSNSPTDPFVYEDTRQKILAGVQVDLSPLRWRLGNKFDTLVELQGDESKRANARSVDDVMKSANRLLLGKSEAKTTVDFEKQEAFRRAVDEELSGYQKQTGKPATSEVAQQITDRLLIKVGTGWFGSKRFYEIGQNDSFSLGGIPNGRKFYYSGREIGKRDVMDKIVRYLQGVGRPIDEQNISDTYSRLVNQRAIVEKAE